MLENWLMPHLNEDSNDYNSGSLQRRARVSQSKLATKVDRMHRKRRWRVPRFNPVWLFLLGICEVHSLCLHSQLISRFSQPYHRCCGSGRPWYADTRVEQDGLSHRCLPYYQRWTHWASTKYVKKTWRVSLSIGVRTTMIRWVVYLLWIF